jgi:death-on-curing protein
MVISMHSELIAQSGGLDGMRDMNMLDASVNSPFHTFGGQLLYPTIQTMAAHLAFSLIKNHPFLDGFPISCTDEELITLGLGLAENTISEPDLIDWIISRC